MSAEFHVLDLFAGLGGFSAAFDDSDRWDLTTVEIDPTFGPDITADVFDLRPSDFEQEFDVIVASPPCTEFSPAQNLNGSHEPAGDAVALVYHTLGLVRGLSPSYWFIENPRGQLRSLIGRPKETVTYCQYGETRMKPTDLWGEHPDGFVGRRCAYGDSCHEQNREGTNNYPNDPNQKAVVPYGLSDAIREACELALDGDAPTQTTTDEWMQA